jgi:hypothetical protein
MWGNAETLRRAEGAGVPYGVGTDGAAAKVSAGRAGAAGVAGVADCSDLAARASRFS